MDARAKEIGGLRSPRRLDSRSTEPNRTRLEKESNACSSHSMGDPRALNVTKTLCACAHARASLRPLDSARALGQTLNSCIDQSSKDLNASNSPAVESRNALDAILLASLL